MWEYVEMLKGRDLEVTAKEVQPSPNVGSVFIHESSASTISKHLSSFFNFKSKISFLKCSLESVVSVSCIVS